MTYLATLPGELRSLIFDHVDNNHDLYECLLVNKQFYMELMPLLWRHLDIRNKHILTKMITTLTQYAPAEHYIRSMVVASKITEEQLLAIVQHAPFLEHLSLCRAKKITDMTFQQVVRYCPRLISLYISNATAITQLSMDAIGQYCHQLRQIDLLNCHGLDASLFSALHPCPLEKISVNCCHLDGMTNDPAMAASARMALARFSALTSLHLFEIYNDCTPLIIATTTTNTDHLSIWPCLTYLNLNLCPNLDDAKAIQIIKGHPKLTTLYLSGTGITDRTLDAISLYLPDIVNLRIAFSDKVTASGLYRLVKHCTKLEDGVGCHGNRIYQRDHDFPSHLDERFYRTENHFEEERELSWLTNDNDNK